GLEAGLAPGRPAQVRASPNLTWRQFMYGEFRVVDADRHVMEPPDLWRRYTEPAYRERVELSGFLPAWHHNLTGRSGFAAAFSFTEHPISREPSPAARNPAFAPPPTRGARAGGAAAVPAPSPGAGRGAPPRDDTAPARPAAPARAYNNWLADFCAQNPNRLKGT